MARTAGARGAAARRRPQAPRRARGPRLPRRPSGPSTGASRGGCSWRPVLPVGVSRADRWLRATRRAGPCRSGAGTPRLSHRAGRLRRRILSAPSDRRSAVGHVRSAQRFAAQARSLRDAGDAARGDPTSSVTHPRAGYTSGGNAVRAAGTDRPSLGRSRSATGSGDPTARAMCLKLLVCPLGHPAGHTRLIRHVLRAFGTVVATGWFCRQVLNATEGRTGPRSGVSVDRYVDRFADDRVGPGLGGLPVVGGSGRVGECLDDGVGLVGAGREWELHAVGGGAERE